MAQPAQPAQPARPAQAMQPGQIDGSGSGVGGGEGRGVHAAALAAAASAAMVVAAKGAEGVQSSGGSAGDPLDVVAMGEDLSDEVCAAQGGREEGREGLGLGWMEFGAGGRGGEGACCCRGGFFLPSFFDWRGNSQSPFSFL